MKLSLISLFEEFNKTPIQNLGAAINKKNAQKSQDQAKAAAGGSNWGSPLVASAVRLRDAIKDLISTGEPTTIQANERGLINSYRQLKSAAMNKRNGARQQGFSGPKDLDLKAISREMAQFNQVDAEIAQLLNQLRGML